MCLTWTMSVVCLRSASIPDGHPSVDMCILGAAADLQLRLPPDQANALDVAPTAAGHRVSSYAACCRGSHGHCTQRIQQQATNLHRVSSLMGQQLVYRSRPTASREACRE